MTEIKKNSACRQKSLVTPIPVGKRVEVGGDRDTVGGGHGGPNTLQARRAAVRVVAYPLPPPLQNEHAYGSLVGHLCFKSTAYGMNMANQNNMNGMGQNMNAMGMGGMMGGSSAVSSALSELY